MQYFKVVKDDGFYCVIVRVKCEGEWNSVIFFLFVTFVVLTVDQFVLRKPVYILFFLFITGAVGLANW